MKKDKDPHELMDFDDRETADDLKLNGVSIEELEAEMARIQKEYDEKSSQINRP